MHMLPTVMAYRALSANKTLSNDVYDFHVLSDGTALVKGTSWQLDTKIS